MKKEKISKFFLLKYMSKMWLSYFFGIFFLFVCQVFQVMLPKIIADALDLINLQSFDLSQLLKFIYKIIIYAIIIAIGRWGWRFFIHGSARKVNRQIRKKIFQTILNYDDRFFKKNKIGDLMTNFTSDLNILRHASSMGIVHTFEAIIMITMIIFALNKQNPEILFYLLLPYPIISVIIVFVSLRAKKQYENVQKQYGAVSQLVQDTFSGISIVKTFIKEKYFASIFEKENKSLQDLNLKVILIWEITWPVITFLIGITEVFVLIYAGKMVLEGKATIGQLTMTVSYIWMLLSPFMSIGWTIQIIQKAIISSNRIYKILSYTPLVKIPDSGIKEYPKGNIEIKNLNFIYHDGNTEVLKDISLNISKGQIIGILGSLASGKSTLIKALTKLINIENGKIFYDGIDINQYDVNYLRKAIGVVPQVSFLFSDTIKNNIIFGLDEHDEELLLNASEISTINRDLQLFSAGFETEVGERGITLSGGQKQRVAIARAMAYSPNILILDDSMSAVDTQTEERILNSIFENRIEKTTIIISYRISTLKNCDNIFVLKDGSLTESGTHSQLLENNGLYKKIFDMQSLSIEE